MPTKDGVSGEKRIIQTFYSYIFICVFYLYLYLFYVLLLSAINYQGVAVQ